MGCLVLDRLSRRWLLQHMFSLFFVNFGDIAEFVVPQCGLEEAA